ncbi:MAG: hypothetical protein ACR2NG_04490 [Acidimicrobiia bacterium]
MAAQRLPASRIAGIAAWTAATVAWGTTAIAVANEAPGVEAKALGVSQLSSPVEIQAEVLAPAPTLPESGLVVLRYTPVERPDAKTIVRTVTVSSSGAGGSSQPAAPPSKPTKATSSGS